MDEEPGLIDSLRAHWKALVIFTLVIASAAVVAERRLSSGGERVPAEAPAPVTTGEKDPGKAEESKPDAGKPETRSPQADAAAAVASETVMVDARPAALLKGQGKWEGAAKTLSDAVKKLTDAVARAGLMANGRPIAVFTKTDDAGFSFEAMVPLAAAPEGQAKLLDGIDIGASPTGKALKFQHRGAYDEIDATYEAIAAYLDEKGLDTKDLIIEEYLTDFKGESPEVDVDIYVFLK